MSCLVVARKMMVLVVDSRLCVVYVCMYVDGVDLDGCF